MAALLCFLISFLQINEVNGQRVMGIERFSVHVLKDTVLIKNGQFAFNSVTINNTSNQNQILGIRFNLPQGWGFVTVPNSSLEVRRGDFQTIPFRIAHSKSALGDFNYPITMFVKDPVTGKEDTKSFYVRINQNTNWNANLIQPSLIIGEKDSLSRFQLKIKNKGNKRELFDISVKGDLKISLPSEGTQVMLWPGQDTTLKVYVATRYRNNKSNNVLFYVKAKNETIMLSGSVYFTSETYLGHQKKYNYLPLDMEYFNINSLSGLKGYSFFSFSGSYNFDKQRTLNFLARTNAFNSDFSINSQFYSLEYKTQKFELNVGNQNLFFNYQINGIGAKTTFISAKRKSYELYGLKSQIDDSEIFGFKQVNNKRENSKIGVNALLVKDNDNDKLVFFSIHDFEKKYSKTKLVNFSAGYGTEKPDSISQFNLGYMIGYRFETKFSFAKILSTFQYYDNNYPGIMRGLKYGNHTIKLGKESFPIYLYSESNSKQQYVSDDLLNDFQQTFNNQEHGLRFGMNNKYIQTILGFSKVEQFQRNADYGVLNGYKGAINIGINKSKFSQSIIFNAMKTRIYEIKNNRYNDSYDLQYQMRYKSFGLFANYSVGPNFYFDYLSFVSQGVKPSLRNISVNYEFKNSSRTFYDRVNLSNNKNPYANKAVLMLRNEMSFEIPKAKSSISIFTNVNLLAPQTGSSLNISVKKNINIPVVFKQKYYSASFFLFKDKNNNDIFEKGEEPISDVNVLINGQTLKTNKKGMVFLKNVDKGEYYVDYRKIQNLKGWVVKSGNVDTLNLEGDISIGVPFKQSRMVAGRVKFTLENSSKEVNESLGGILIVATNKKGDMFRTSTNENGDFYLNLNEDQYNIQIPTNLFGEGYYIERAILPVDLTKNQYSEVEFVVVQRKRSINIKKL
jgi:hypothetical protein